MKKAAKAGSNGSLGTPAISRMPKLNSMRMPRQSNVLLMKGLGMIANPHEARPMKAKNEVGAEINTLMFDPHCSIRMRNGRY